MEKEAIKIAEHVKSFGSRPESVEKRMDLQKLNDMKSLQQTMEKYDRDKGPNFPQWREDLENMCEHIYPGITMIMRELRKEKEEVTEEKFKKIIEKKGMDEPKWKYQDAIKEVYVCIRRYTTGEARTFVESAADNGLEAYRSVNRNFDGHASGTASQLLEDCTKCGHHRAKDTK